MFIGNDEKSKYLLLPWNWKTNDEINLISQAPFKKKLWTIEQITFNDLVSYN